MSEVRKILERAVGDFRPQGDLEEVARRYRRKQLSQRVQAGLLLGVFAAAFGFLWISFHPAVGHGPATKIHPAASGAPPLSLSAAQGPGAIAYDAATGQVVMFGGWRDGPLGDTWTWDGQSWTLQQPSESPPPRYNAEMAYDPATQEIVLFGGWGNGNGPLGDTWTWDGSAWHQEHPAESPPARAVGLMAYDEPTQDVVLFGGQGTSTTIFDDTWTWDGSTWHEEHPAESAPGGIQNAMAYDPGTGSVLVLSNTPPPGTEPGPKADCATTTWSWTGTTWTMLAPATNPQAAYSSALALDPASNRLVLFQADPRRCLQPATSTWVWGGADWSAVDVANGPDTNGAGSLVADQKLGSLVLFDDKGSTWAWSGSGWALSSPVSQSVSRVADHPASASRNVPSATP